MNHAIYVAQIEVLLSYAVTMQLICAFVIAYMQKISHGTAHIYLTANRIFSYFYLA